LVLISIVAFTLKHLIGALESGHKLCHYFRTEILARYTWSNEFRKRSSKYSSSKFHLILNLEKNQNIKTVISRGWMSKLKSAIVDRKKAINRMDEGALAELGGWYFTACSFIRADCHYFERSFG
jgi:hypothetical protein